MKPKESVVCRACMGNGSYPVRTQNASQLGWGWQLCVTCHGSGRELVDADVIDVDGYEVSRKLRPYARYEGGRHG